MPGNLPESTQHESILEKAKIKSKFQSYGHRNLKQTIINIPLHLLVWTRCFLVWQSIYNTYPPGRRRTSHSDWMKNSIFQIMPNWLGWVKSGRIFSHPKRRQHILNNSSLYKNIEKLCNWKTWLCPYPQNMIPHWSASKVNVEVGIAVFHPH